MKNPVWLMFVLAATLGDVVACGGEVSGPGGSSGNKSGSSAGGTAASAGSGGARGDLATGCSLDSDCGAPLRCALRLCHTACESSRDCPEGERCMTTDRPFYVCQLAAEQACAYNSQCPAVQICGTDGQCRDQCTSDRDCVTGQSCVSGSCVE